MYRLSNAAKWRRKKKRVCWESTLSTAMQPLDSKLANKVICCGYDQEICM